MPPWCCSISPPAIRFFADEDFPSQFDSAHGVVAIDAQSLCGSARVSALTLMIWVGSPLAGAKAMSVLPLRFLAGLGGTYSILRVLGGHNAD
jgi:hypothetical protein